MRARRGSERILKLSISQNLHVETQRVTCLKDKIDAKLIPTAGCGRISAAMRESSRRNVFFIYVYKTDSGGWEMKK